MVAASLQKPIELFGELFLDEWFSNAISSHMTDDRHNPNQELMGQGIANMIVPFFGGIPATGTIARTVTNIKAGAFSPVAGVVHAFTLLVVILAAAPLASNIPLCALAAILVFVDRKSTRLNSSH